MANMSINIYPTVEFLYKTMKLFFFENKGLRYPKKRK